MENKEEIEQENKPIDKKQERKERKETRKSVISSLMNIKPISLKDKRYKDNRPFMIKLKVPWIFYSWIEKVLLVAGFVALFYSIIRIIMQGFW